jgi:hypothetical protein
MSNRPFNVTIPGVPLPLTPTQAVAYLAGQGRSPKTIAKQLKGQMTDGAVRQAMCRARKNNPGIPTWYGGLRSAVQRVRAG